MANCDKCGQEIAKKPIDPSLTQFLELITNQFKYGGQKYAQTKEKEATDVLFDDFGKNWLLGTIAKYCKRYSNLARERDLLKIATYMFIIWLKRGFHLKEEGSMDVINTTVEAKTKYFPKFIGNIVEYISYNELIETDTIGQIYTLLKDCEGLIFELTPEKKFLQIFHLAYHTWNKDIKEKGKDEDVYNEIRTKGAKK